MLKKKSLSRDLEHIKMTWMKFIEMNAAVCGGKHTLHCWVRPFCPLLLGPPSCECWCVSCCPGGLLGCVQFFFLSSFSFLYSILWQWFPPFCLPGHFPVLLPQLFCYRFLVVYCLSLFFGSSRSFVKQFLDLLHSFPNPGSSSLSLFWIFFLEGCLSPLHLAVFLGFCPFL